MREIEDLRYSYEHTKERMEERYNYKDLTIEEYRYLCKHCMEGTKLKSEFVPNRGYQYILRTRFKDMFIIVVYTSWERKVNTVLPYDHFKNIHGSTYVTYKNKKYKGNLK